MLPTVPYGPGKVIPPEIWSQILVNLPKVQLPNMLSVCSLFHDIAIRTIFSSIKVYFLGGDRGMDILNDYYEIWTTEIMTKLLCKSWEILNRICQDPQFAKVVKSITVIAFGEGLGMLERLTVANVFSFVPNLQTFRWIGESPPLDDIVAKSLPETLKELVVQSPIFPLDFLQHIQKLKTLYLSMPFFFPDCDEAHDFAVDDFQLADDIVFHVPIEDILNTFSSTLQCLRLCASDIEDVPIQVYDTLRELEIFKTNFHEVGIRGLDVMFRHATSLEALSMCGLLDPECTSFLPDYSSTHALPLLTSFRLSTDDEERFEEEFSALRGFLKGRSSLRRLSIRIPQLALPEAIELFRVIRDLKGLEVLGLHTGVDHISDAGIMTLLVDGLSPNLRALHLATTCEGKILEQLVEGIIKLPRLSFLHLYGVKDELRISIPDLAHKVQGLDTIGLRRSLWSIDRVDSDTLTLKYWPRWKIKFCVEQDFSCADDAWLFTYN